jgi:hypothetical protein
MKFLYPFRPAAILVPLALLIPGCRAELPQPPAPRAEGAGRSLKISISTATAETSPPEGAASPSVTH